MPRRLPKFDAAIVERMRDGDYYIPPQEFRDLLRKRNGESRVADVIYAALTEGERPQRRRAVAAIVSLIEGLAGDDESPKSHAYRLRHGRAVSTEQRMAEWAEQALKDERDDTP